MANFVTDIIDPLELINYARIYDNEILMNQFALTGILPPLPIPDLEYRISRNSVGDVEAASFRAWDTPVAFANRQGLKRITGEIVPIGRQIALGEEDHHRLRSMLSDDSTGMISQIYADMEHMLRSVQSRLEFARAQVLTTGKLTIAENGLQLEADYGIDALNLVTAATVHSDVSANALDDLLTWHQRYIDSSGGPAGYILCSTKWKTYLTKNDQMRSAAAFAGTTPIQLNGETLNAVLSTYDLPPLVTYDKKGKRGGVSERFLPENKAIFLPPAGEQLGHTYYGITTEAMVFAERGFIDAAEAPGVVGFVTAQEHPVHTFTHAAANAVPVLGNPELIMVATTHA